MKGKAVELFCSKIKYTRESMASIIKNKEDRSLAVEAAIKSVGGNMLGFYGMLGQKHDAMVIAEFPSKIEYMALIAKVMAAGAMSDISTITLFTGADVVKSTTMASAGDVNYHPPEN